MLLTIAYDSAQIVAWLPLLVAAMMAGYIIVRYKPSTRSRFQLRALGLATDFLSLILFALVVVVGTSPNCLWLSEEETFLIRPDDALPTETRDGFGSFSNDFQYKSCDITWKEYTLLHGSGDIRLGRFPTTTATYIKSLRMGSPIVLLWLCCMAYDEGYTARLLSSWPFVKISTLTYHLYLLHMPITRYYIMATRGLAEAEFWWPYIPQPYPVPMEWWEFIVVVALSLSLGVVIEHFLTPVIQPYTISLGLKVSERVSDFFHFVQDGPAIHGGRTHHNATTTDIEKGDSPKTMVKNQVLSHIEGLTGSHQVALSTHLSDLGLDSLGTTALLSSLKASIPEEAKNLTLVDLVKCETVSDLIELLTPTS